MARLGCTRHLLINWGKFPLNMVYPSHLLRELGSLLGVFLLVWFTPTRLTLCRLIASCLLWGPRGVLQGSGTELS